MRIGVSLLLGLLFLAPMCCLVAHGQGRTKDKHVQLEDPMFGISYSSGNAHYEPMPMAIRQICPGYKRGTFWVFAHLQNEREHYYVVMGTRPGQDGDSLGAALVVKDAKCYVEDSTWMLSGTIPEKGYGQTDSVRKLPGLNVPEVCEKGPQFSYGMGPCHYVLQSAEEESVLRGLVSDALARGVNAWGDAIHFKRAVCSSSYKKENSTTPIVQQELTKFCK